MAAMTPTAMAMRTIFLRRRSARWRMRLWYAAALSASSSSIWPTGVSAGFLASISGRLSSLRVSSEALCV